MQECELTVLKLYTYRAEVVSALCIEIFQDYTCQQSKFRQDIFTVKNSSRPSKNPNDTIHH